MIICEWWWACPITCDLTLIPAISCNGTNISPLKLIKISLLHVDIVILGSIDISSSMGLTEFTSDEQASVFIESQLLGMDPKSQD